MSTQRATLQIYNCTSFRTPYLHLETRRICSSKHETTFMHHEITMLVGKEMNNHYTTTTSFTHLLYLSKTCTVAAIPSEKKKYHATTSLLHCTCKNPNFLERRSCHVSSCHCTIKVVKAGQIFKSCQILVKQERLKCKY